MSALATTANLTSVEKGALLLEQAFLIAKLEAKVAELEARLSKHSGNSSKPPLSDRFHKPAPRSRRTKGQRTAGGQPGHTGHTLKRVESPDYIESHNPLHCEAIR